MTSNYYCLGFGSLSGSLRQDSAFEAVLLEFNMQFEISLKFFVHIHSFLCQRRDGT